MPHDKNGVELQCGDRVLVECEVKQIQLTPDYCNLSLETVEAMAPSASKSALSLNSKQVVKKA